MQLSREQAHKISNSQEMLVRAIRYSLIELIFVFIPLLYDFVAMLATNLDVKWNPENWIWLRILGWPFIYAMICGSVLIVVLWIPMTLVASGLMIFLWLFRIVAVLRLCDALKMNVIPLTLCVVAQLLAFNPVGLLIAFVTLLLLNRKATKMLQASGLSAGFMEASRLELERYGQDDSTIASSSLEMDETNQE